MIDPIFNLFKVKFSILDDMGLFRKKKASIYIDLEIVFKYLFTSRVNQFIAENMTKQSAQLCLMSNIINLAQHYRLYCAKHHIDNFVVLYWNKPDGIPHNNRMYIPDYREYYDNKMANRVTCQYIRDRFNTIQHFLEITMKYVNQVYMISSENVESSLIPYILSKDIWNDDRQHIIVTDDKYGFQYVTHGFDVLVPNKDKSVLLKSNNLINYLKEMNNIKSPKTVPINYVPFIISLLGNKYRNIPRISGIGLSSIINLINKGIDDFIVTPNTTNIDMLKEIIPEENRDRFIKNYHCTDLIYQYRDLSVNDIHKVASYLIDKYDDNALIQFNDRYFKEYPLMLINTLKEQILNDTNEKSIFE